MRAAEKEGWNWVKTRVVNHPGFIWTVQEMSIAV
jgi:hypothetical protein